MKQQSEQPGRPAIEVPPSGMRQDLSSSQMGTSTLKDQPLPIKIKSILVPTDFSAESEKAIAYATDFARQFGAKITLLHVVEPGLPPDFAKLFPIAKSTPEVLESYDRELKELAARMHLDPEVIDKTMVTYGRSFHEIVDVARTLGTDLIIIPTHGYTGLKHALLGSTTERVVQHAPCMVLVLRSPDFVQAIR